METAIRPATMDTSADKSLEAELRHCSCILLFEVTGTKRMGQEATEQMMIGRVGEMLLNCELWTKREETKCCGRAGELMG